MINEHCVCTGLPPAPKIPTAGETHPTLSAASLAPMTAPPMITCANMSIAPPPLLSIPPSIPLLVGSHSQETCPDVSSYTAISTPQEEKLECVLNELPEAIAASTDFSLKLGSDYEERKYQRKLAEPGMKGENYIVVLPTGHGKTLVAAFVISNHLQKNQHHQSCHVVFVVNTRPLAEQQKDKLKSYIPNARVGIYTGEYDSTMKDSIRGNNISVCTAGKLREEVRDGYVTFDQFTLMVFDECHHAAQKGDIYARLMERFLEYKENNPLADLPQIIGMTASPGGNHHVIRAKSIDHLLKLAALMNATGSYHFTPNQLQKNHSYTCETVKPRDTCNDPFIDLIVAEMNKLEARVPGAKNRFSKWLQAYGTKVQQLKESFELLKDDKLRDDISTLDLLGCYYNALHVYMDLQQQDAIQEVANYSGFPGDDNKATQCELDIKRQWKFFLERLKQIPIRANPILDKMMETLYEAFRTCRQSRALIFVPSKKHTYCVCNFLRSKHSALHGLVVPDVITGQANEGMTQIEQESVLSKFRTGKVNVLVSTSVLQEGLDVSECNLVIRYQHVSNEIAQIQAETRARAENSQGITILSSDSKKVREVRNIELAWLVNDIFENNYLPTGCDFEKEIKRIQTDIVTERREKVVFKEQLRHSQTSDTIKLYCKHCKQFACNGSDIYLEGPHHVVPISEFQKKITLKELNKPLEINSGQTKTHKVHCTDCGNDWGSVFLWKKSGRTFPALKCVRFAFEIDGHMGEAIPNWRAAPFTIKPLSDWFTTGSEDKL